MSKTQGWVAGAIAGARVAGAEGGLTFCYWNFPRQRGRAEEGRAMESHGHFRKQEALTGETSDTPPVSNLTEFRLTLDLEQVSSLF